MALALPGVEWLEYSFQNFEHLVDQPYEVSEGRIFSDPRRRATGWFLNDPACRTWRRPDVLMRGEQGHVPPQMRLRPARAPERSLKHEFHTGSRRGERDSHANPAHVSGAQRSAPLFSLATVFFVLLALYCGVLSVLLPNQIQAIDPIIQGAQPCHRVRDHVGLQHDHHADRRRFIGPNAHALGAAHALDRHRLGKVGATSLFITSQMQTFWTITFFWVLAGADQTEFHAGGADDHRR